jgi:hypothetical protein
MSGAWCCVFSSQAAVSSIFSTICFFAQKIIKSAYYVPNHKQGRMLFIYQVWHHTSKLTLI